MMKNKRGQVFLGVVLGLFIYVTGILFLPFITSNIDTSRVALDCTNSSITDGNKLTCLEIDAVTPYFIWFIISMALGLIIGGIK